MMRICTRVYAIGGTALAETAVGTSTPRFWRKRVFITNWAIIPDVMRFRNADATWRMVSGPKGTSFAGGIAPSIDTE